MQIESEITVGRPRAEVFDYIARGECLPEYVADFEWVKQDSDGQPALGTSYSYKMARGAQGTFEWTEFQPHSRLAWHGPPAKAGPGSMEPSGWWELTDAGDGTRVKLVMAPKPGGLFKLMAPLMSRSMSKGNDKALALLKGQLESAAAPSAADSAPPASDSAPPAPDSPPGASDSAPSASDSAPPSAPPA